jgi:aconitase A
MGYLASPRLVDDVNLLGTVSYNPYKNDQFVLDNGDNIAYSYYAELDHDGKHVHINAW